MTKNNAFLALFLLSIPTLLFFQNFESSTSGLNFEDIASLTVETCSARPECKIIPIPQTDDKALITSIDAALAEAKEWNITSSKVSYVLFDQASSYRIRRRLDSWSSININNHSRIVFDGNGSSFTPDASNTFLSVQNCRACVFKNFRVKQTAGIYTQGHVVQMDRHSVTIRVEAGFPLLEFASQLIDNSTVGVGKPHFTGVMFMKEGDLWTFAKGQQSANAPRPHLMAHSMAVVDRALRSVRINLDNLDPAFKRNAEFYAGKFQAKVPLRFAIMLPNIDREKVTELEQKEISEVGDPSGHLFLLSNKNLLIQNVQMHFSPTRAILARGNEGHLIFRAVTLAPERTEQLLSVMNGSFILLDNEHGRIDRSRVLGSLDDMVNAVTNPLLLQSKNGSTYTLKTGSSRAVLGIDAGDVFQYFDPKRKKTSGETRSVTAVEQVDLRTYKVTFNLPFTDLLLSAADNLLSADQKFATRFYNLSKSHSGLRITNSHFERGSRNAILCSGCSVDGSVFQNIALHALGAGNREERDGSQPGGPFPDQAPLVFTNNQTNHVRDTVIKVHVLSPAPAVEIKIPDLNPVIVIKRNVFTNPGTSLYQELGFKRTAPCGACSYSGNTPEITF